MNEKEEYFEFLSKVAVRVSEILPGKVVAEITTSRKNNGVSMTGLMVKEEGEQIAPNFYLNRQHEEWKNGRKSLEEISQQLCHAYREEMHKSSHLISEIRFQWEEFQRNVCMRLVNRDRNKDLLKEVPYVEFLDLAIVYYYTIDISDGVTGTMIINSDHLQMLQVTQEELHRAAKRNIRRIGSFCVRSMEEVIGELGKRAGVSLPELDENRPLMYVLTNKTGTFGAISMYFTEELERIATQIGDSFFLLPSSVHEVILVPDYGELCPEGLAAMVKEINLTQVEETEVLSDSVYYFDRNLNKLRRIG